jgi:hypothetical protein
LNTLVYVYASSRDQARINSAKQLLHAMLNDSDLNHDQEVPFPNINTCKAVLSGMERSCARRIRPNGNGPQQFSVKALAKVTDQDDIAFAIKLLDQMCTRCACWPDQGYFHSVFRLLLLSRLTNAGDVAEQLLSKMHIRECFSNGPTAPVTVTVKTYDSVLGAWLVSAKAGYPGSAKRAFELIGSMAAQSISLLGPPKGDNPPAYKLSVTPDRSTYHLVLKICSAVKVTGEKERAMDIALAAKGAMTKQGITPTAETFSLLFACCDNLVKDQSKRRETVTQELLAAARNQGTLNEAVLERLKAQNGLELDDVDVAPTDEKKPEQRFSLLSDLK